ncbi:broad-complex core protein isoforms 1/2/3/4/5-like isoform X2 [Periplaneta americana]|uniref:broad-complex core protein isoforms 1/2/3/4/5-like isoform X2 n=1 Tax=Periplaneta americana TaxID=6978 RepID=UPI0037E7C2A6
MLQMSPLSSLVEHIRMSDLWLKWNSQQELISSLDSMLESECFVDVTIAVEGQLLKAHRIVLCASSCYFSSILRSNSTPHPIIFMRDVKYVEMKAILDFIYKGEAYVTQENIQGVLKTAEALKITGLSSISWTESSMNYVQVDEASQCEVADSLPPEILPALNDNPSSSCQSTEEAAAAGTTESYKEETKVAHVSASEDGERLMILEAPSNISITSVSSAPVRQKPAGRQYTKEDLKQALEVIRQGQMGIKPAARAFKIPVATLHHAARRSKISSPMQQGGNYMMSYRSRGKAVAPK